MLVHADDECGVRVFCGRGDEDFFGPRGDMLARARLVEEQAGAFEGNADLEVLPGKLSGVPLGQHGDLFAVHDDLAVAGLDVMRKFAEG